MCWRTMERHYAPSVYDPEFEHLVEVLALRVRDGTVGWPQVA
jgi:hypothetical protein